MIAVTSRVKHVNPISGKDSFCTACIQKKRRSDISYEYVYNDTGMELSETYEWVNRAEKHLRQPIHRIGENLKDIIYGFNYLHSHQDRYCTRMAKIHPMEDWIGVNNKAYVYYGIRADEKRVGYKSFSNKFDITPIYPLQEEGYTLSDVWQYMHEIDLMPPQFFWQEMYERVMSKLSGFVNWVGLSKPADFLSKFKPWEQSVLFAGKSRPNCRQCHYQRLYEHVWLAETHSELFADNVQIEEDIGHRETEVDMNIGLWQGMGLGTTTRTYQFTLNARYSLKMIVAQAERIKRDRARQITKVILSRWNVKLEDPEEIEEQQTDWLGITSCGLLCGK